MYSVRYSERMGEDDDIGAVLTPRQRDYLKGEEDDLSDGAGRALKARMRKRIRASLEDFYLLDATLSETERDKILDVESARRDDLLDGMVSAISLFYEIHEREKLDFEDTVSRAVGHVYSRGLRSPDPQVVEDVTLNIDLAPYRHAREDGARKALQKYHDGEELSRGDVESLINVVESQLAAGENPDPNVSSGVKQKQLWWKMLEDFGDAVALDRERMREESDVAERYE